MRSAEVQLRSRLAGEHCRLDSALTIHSTRCRFAARVNSGVSARCSPAHVACISPSTRLVPSFSLFDPVRVQGHKLRWHGKGCRTSACGRAMRFASLCRPAPRSLRAGCTPLVESRSPRSRAKRGTSSPKAASTYGARANNSFKPRPFRGHGAARYIVTSPRPQNGPA